MNLKCYLAGPINRKIPDQFEFAKKWRNDIAVELNAMNIDCYDPLKKNGGDSLTLEQHNRFKTACGIGDLETINDIVGNIIIPNDLEMVKDSDFIIIYLPKRDGYEVCGTYGEATLAKYLGIPVYLMTERENNEIPEWLIGCCKDVFCSWDALLLRIFNTYHSVRRVD